MHGNTAQISILSIQPPLSLKPWTHVEGVPFSTSSSLYSEHQGRIAIPSGGAFPTLGRWCHPLRNRPRPWKFPLPSKRGKGFSAERTVASVCRASWSRSPHPKPSPLQRWRKACQWTMSGQTAGNPYKQPDSLLKGSHEF